MKSLITSLVLFTGLAISFAGAQPANPPAARSGQDRPRLQLPPGVQALRDLEYGRVGERAMLLDLYLPENNEKPRPLIIWIHGGAWLSGSRSNSSPALQFLRENFAVAQVGYRLSPEAKFPAQIHDCKAAVRWLRSNARRYNLNADKFIAWGSSAGGHLVALLGTSGDVAELEGAVNTLKESSRVQAVIDWFGPTDFLTIGQSPSSMKHDAADSPEGRLIGGAITENRDKAAKASPIIYVSKDDPPFLIMHGDQDMTVPFQQSEVLHEALKKAGVDSTFVPMKGAGHGFGGPQAMEPVREFLQRCAK